MSYTSRRTEPELTPEEQDVATALSDYSDQPADGACPAVWVPTEQLYRLYMLWTAEHRWRRGMGGVDRITRRQFGRALPRVFPLATRCRRRNCGRNAWGYSHLIGPDARCSR